MPHRFAIAFLMLQGIGGVVWWTVLFLFPTTRASFMVPDAPETTLTAFALPDLFLFSGGALVSAYGYWKEKIWAWPTLCVHAGAATYAALYCLLQFIMAPASWLAALLMSPSLVIPLSLCWCLRPEGFRHVQESSRT